MSENSERPDTGKLPKAELHCHIEGAVRPALALEQARKYGVDASGVIDGEGGYRWHDFTSFLAVYNFITDLFRTPEDYALLAEDHYRNLAAQNCLYGEIFISPENADRIDCAYQTLIEAIAEGYYRARQVISVEGRFIIVGERHLGVEAVENAARLAVSHRHPLVTGFGMAGDERSGRQADFTRAFAIAGEGGLALTVHAGELCGADSVRGALDHLGITRIGHGVRAAEDPSLITRLAEEQIVLEICPASNIALGVYPDFNAHPFVVFDRAGCVVTLNSDDPPHFHSSISHEYEIAAEAFGYDAAALLRFTKNALRASFTDGDTRNRLLEKCAGGGVR